MKAGNYAAYSAPNWRGVKKSLDFAIDKSQPSASEINLL
jgi:hypothetical protein